jgi:primosomal replication protein N
MCKRGCTSADAKVPVPQQQGRALVSLTARLVERSVVRYSPAGVPVLECRLEHRSTQLEAEVPREVEFEIKALALGSIVTEFERIAPGTELAFQGFLAPTRKGSKTLLLHITRFDQVDQV